MLDARTVRDDKELVRQITVSRKTADCPVCGSSCKRHKHSTRKLREIGVTKPTWLQVTVSVHECEQCKKHFNLDISYLADPSARYTRRVKRQALHFVLKMGWNFERACKEMLKRYFVPIPVNTLHSWMLAEIA